LKYSRFAFSSQKHQQQVHLPFQTHSIQTTDQSTSQSCLGTQGGELAICAAVVDSTWTVGYVLIVERQYTSSPDTRLRLVELANTTLSGKVNQKSYQRNLPLHVLLVSLTQLLRAVLGLIETRPRSRTRIERYRGWR